MPLYKMRDPSGEIIRGAVIATIAIVVALIVALLIASMAVFGFGWFERGTANFRGKTSEINQVNSGNYRIAAYDSFFDQCSAIQTDEQRVKNTLQELAATTDTDRKAQLQANLDAQKNQMVTDINQYNADARKTDTKGHFRASELPYQIDPNTDPTKEITSCNS